MDNISDNKIINDNAADNGSDNDKNIVISERLAAVRGIMKANGVDIYVVVTGDYHISEYAGDYFKEREFISGFTGSAGTAVITSDTAVLFTDGRYFVQAEKQLSGTEYKLMRMGSAGVPALNEYCRELLKEGMTIGFDGRCVQAGQGIEFKKMAEFNKAYCNYSFDAIEQIYEGRAEFPHSKAFYLDTKYSGKTIKEKLADVRGVMKDNMSDVHIIASLDDICWLFNIRGRDVHCNPVIMAYAAVYMDKTVLYTDIDRLDECIDKLIEAGVEVKSYNDIYEDIRSIAGHKVLIDKKRVNTRLYLYAKDNDKIELVEKENPEVLLKAVKNDTEIANLKDVHIDDGLAVTRFIFWLKKAVKSGQTITEASAAEYLDNLRSGIKDYIELSFDTISAYADNAAMMHYQASKDNCSTLKQEGMLLVDSGGQYMRGTTDITRTIALGEVTDEMKKCYTLTLKGMLNLANTRFLHGCTGYNLDIMARAPLWNENIDYRCGTGHGVGYLLNVHEAPNGFRWKHIQGVNDLAILTPGMVTSDEPGVYADGRFGIRIENEIIVTEDKENEYGRWLKFEMLTMVPVDLELVDVQYLNDKDIEQLNNYHKQVYNALSPYMKGEELEQLAYSTREL